MKNETYHYMECGLPNIYLTNGFRIEQTPYGKGVSIINIPGLHRCIALALCQKPEPLTGGEFRFLRLELDFSQKMFAEILGCDPRSIRRIEKSQRDKGVRRPYDILVRSIYSQAIDPKNTIMEVFERLREFDREMDDGWHNRLNLQTGQDASWTLAA